MMQNTSGPRPHAARRARGQDRSISILVDGPDLCGKSTLVNTLVQRLAADGYRVAQKKGVIQRRWIHRYLDRFDANKRHASALLNSLYLLSCFLDRAPVADTDIVVCESFVDRVIAYGMTCRLKSLAPLAFLGRRLFRRFDLQVLLHASHATRESRLKKRQDATLIDRKTTATADISWRFCEAFRASSRRSGNVIHEYDTGLVAVEEIVETLVRRVRELKSLDRSASLDALQA